MCHVTELCLQLLQPSNPTGCPPPSPFWGGKQGIANPCAAFLAFGCCCHVPFSPLDRGLNLPGVPGSQIIPKIPFFLSSALFLQVLQPSRALPGAHGSTKPLQKVVNPTPAIPSAPAGAVGEQLSITTGFIHCYLFPFSRSQGVLSPPGACSIPGGRNTPSSYFAF